MDEEANAIDNSVVDDEVNATTDTDSAVVDDDDAIVVVAAAGSGTGALELEFQWCSSRYARASIAYSLVQVT